jgi:UDP-N-acetylmuramoylalanine--D-glutamate ligase
MGVTGTAAAKALSDAGASVVTVDREAPADHADVSELSLDGFDLAIASPGWPPHGDALRAVEAAGIEIWSEVELAWRLRRDSVPWVLVTGTNGKTTTVQMIGSIARAAGLRCAVVGNVGEPVVRAAKGDLDLVVVEVSSFQLHFTSSVEPLASACLNVDDDHADWHGSREAYAAAKAKVFAHARVACVYPAADSVIEGMVRGADVAEGCRAVGLTLGAPAVSQLGFVDGLMVDRAFHDARHREALPLASITDLEHLVVGPVPPYLAFDALAAAALARAAGIGSGPIGEGLRSFALDAHRTTVVARVAGVAYVDDSKATNPHAARAALSGVAPGTAVWIAGGLPKGADFDPLVKEVASRLRAVVIIGLDPAPILGALERHAPGIPVTVIEPGETVMKRAVMAARELAREGDVVLLSPACASMDQFRDYADRGRSFAAAVEEMT